MKVSLLEWFRFLLSEDFDWEQFSKPQSSGADDDAIMNALRAIESDPEGKQALKASKDQAHDNVLTQNKNLLLKKGIDISKLQRLGQGAGGIAYDMGNGKVFKVTEDVNEAKVSTSLKGKNIPGIATVYDVWKFPTSKMYGIILEKVLPFEKWPNDAFKSSVEEVVDTFNLKGMLQKYQGDWNKIWQEISSSPFLDNDKEHLKQALDVFQRMIQSLGTAGITNFFDVHLGNLGKRANGEVVMFDIGFAQGGQEPSTLNEFLKWLQREQRNHS